MHRNRVYGARQLFVVRGRLAVTTIVLIACGCKTPPGADDRGVVLDDARRAAPVRSVVGHSVEGRPIEVESYGTGPDVVLIMAAIHGDEPASAVLVRCLADYLRENAPVLAGRRVILMPVANPDGLKRGTRRNVHGVDLNRDFPANNRKPTRDGGTRGLSDPESQAIYDLLHRDRPSRIVSIHQPLECVDYDGPAEDLARAMAAQTTLPCKKLGARPGSLGAYAGETLGIPIVTLELPNAATSQSPQGLWEVYGRCLLAAITYPEPPPEDAGRHAVGPLTARPYVTAITAGGET